MILFKDGGEKCGQCHKLQQELVRAEGEMVTILPEVQQARKNNKLFDGLKVGKLRFLVACFQARLEGRGLLNSVFKLRMRLNTINTHFIKI